jgi:hypothetical protein
LRDAAYEGTEFINGFHKAVVESVQGFKDMIIVTEDGEQRLTEFGQQLQDMSTDYLVKIVELVKNLIEGIKDLLPTIERLWEVILVPLRIIDGLLNSESRLIKGLLIFAATWKAISFLGIPALLRGMGGGLMALGKWLFPSAAAAAGVKMAGVGASIGAGATGLAARAGLMSGTVMGPKGGIYKALKGGGISYGGKRALAAGGTRVGLSMLGKGVLAASGVGTAALAAWTAYDLLKMGGILQSGGYVQPMAGGGSMGGGRPYLVGEQGPELFMPGNTGKMLNTGQTQDLLGGKIILRDVSIGIDSFGGIA